MYIRILPLRADDTAAGPQRRISKDFIDLKPDALSILIGVNGLGGSAGAGMPAHAPQDAAIGKSIEVPTP